METPISRGRRVIAGDILKEYRRYIMALTREWEAKRRLLEYGYRELVSSSLFSEEPETPSLRIIEDSTPVTSSTP